MNEQVNAMVTGYRASVENALNMISDESKTTDLRNVYEELLKLADQHGDDLATFVSQATASDLFTRLTSEVAKANQNLQEQQEDPTTAKTADKEDIKRTYQLLLEQIETRPYMKKTAEVYGEIVALADRYDEVTAYQQAIYERGLLHKAAAMNLCDTAKRDQECRDPNDRLAYKLYARQMQASDEAVSGDQLHYLDLKASLEHTTAMAAEAHKYYFVEKLFLTMLDYHDQKTRLRLEELERHPDYLLDLQQTRATIRRLYEELEYTFDLDFDTIIVQRSWVRDLLAVGFPLQKCNRIWMAQDPGNLDFFRDLLYNEILSEASIVEVLQRPCAVAYNPPATPEQCADEGLYDKWCDWVKEHAEKYEWVTADDVQIRDSLDHGANLTTHADDTQRRGAFRQGRSVLESVLDQVGDALRRNRPDNL